MKIFVFLFYLSIIFLSFAQAKVYEQSNAIPMKEIDDAFSLSYQNTAVTFSYQGSDQFRVMQIKTGYDREGTPLPEILFDQRITLSDRFNDINLQGFSVLAKIKTSSNKMELIVTRDIINYVDLSVEDVKFSKDELTFNVCNKGNEDSISEQKLDVMILPNFVEGGSENVIIGEKFKENIMPNDCEEIIIDTDDLKIAPKEITKITIFLPYNDFVWSNTPIDADQSNNKINVNIKKSDKQPSQENENANINQINVTSSSQENVKEITIEMGRPLSLWQKLTKYFIRLFS